MVLALDTSTKTATAAIVKNKNILSEFSVYSDKTHSKALIPMIDSLFKMAGAKLSDIDYIACVNGPGSFTGLRIGASVAKSFSFALSKKIAKVSSLDVLAYSTQMPEHTVCAVMDARNNHVYCSFYKQLKNADFTQYAGYFRAGDNFFVRLTDYMAIPIDEAVKIGQSFSDPLFFIGDGAECYKDFFKEQNAGVAESYLNRHRAGILGIYAQNNEHMLEYVEGKDFTPVYFRRQERD